METTYEQKQIERLVKELLVKDAWSKLYVRKCEK